MMSPYGDKGFGRSFFEQHACAMLQTKEKHWSFTHENRLWMIKSLGLNMGLRVSGHMTDITESQLLHL